MRTARVMLCTAFALGVASAPRVSAEYLAVEQIDKGLFISSEPTVTHLWRSDLGEEARATLVFVPGGAGSVGMKTTWPADAPYLTRYHFNRTLKQLSDKSATTGAFHVVIYDHPMKFQDMRQLTDRTSDDHMVRIENVVRHYAGLLKKPVWLMGHSNGGYSIAEFQRYMAKNGKSDLVQGLIFSAGREEARFTENVNKPMLFLVAEQDGCSKTSPASNQSAFERVRETNKAPTEFVWIKTAQAEPRDPCFSGIHMYFGAGEEVGRVLDQFLTRHVEAR
jgi:hypothetical protein